MLDAAILKTARLVLRPPVLSDAQKIADRIGVKDVVWNLGRAPYPYHLSDAEDWITRSINDRKAGSEYPFVIDDQTESTVGVVGINQHPGDIWEIGYWVGTSWWGRGYVTEAGQALLDWGEKMLGITAWISGHFVDNPASGRVLTKLGFEPVGLIDLPGKARRAASPALRYKRGSATTSDALGFANHD